MINRNPETVSTDYDTADRLYFEPLTSEDVLEIITTERQNGTLHGVIVQFGGQTPLKLARALEAADVPILGTSPDAIDLAEDRDRFKRVLDKLHLKQPKNGIAYSVEQARLVAADLGLPLVVRPSYVLGGRAMQIIREDNQLSDYLLGTLPELVRRRQGALSERQDRADQHRARQEPAAVRPLSFRRHRDRCRLPVRWQGHVHRRDHGAYRGSRYSLRRLRLLAAAAFNRRPDDLRAGAADAGAGARPRCGRIDERAIRHQGWRNLCAGSQSAGVPHRAICGQGDRHAGGKDRGAADGRRKACGL